MTDRTSVLPTANRTSPLGGMAVPLLLGLMTLVGIYSWARILGGAPGSVSFSDHAPWGLFIALFLLLESLAAGALFLAAIPGIWNGRRDSTRLATLLVGLVAGLCAGLAILPDLGAPLQAWRLLFSPNAGSPMLLDVWLLALNLLLGLLLWWAIAAGRDEVMGGASWLQAVAALALPVGTAWLFSSMLGRPGWGSALLVPEFLIQAAIGGVSVAILLGLRVRASLDLRPLNQAMVAALLAQILLVVGQAGFALYRNGPETIPYRALLVGSNGLLFWAAVLFGMALPVAMVWTRRGHTQAPWLALAGVALSKYQFMVLGNQYPMLTWPESTFASSLVAGSGGYRMLPSLLPTWEEWAVALGVLALFGLLVNLGLRRVRPLD